MEGTARHLIEDSFECEPEKWETEGQRVTRPMVWSPKGYFLPNPKILGITVFNLLSTETPCHFVFGKLRI